MRLMLRTRDGHRVSLNENRALKRLSMSQPAEIILELSLPNAGIG